MAKEKKRLKIEMEIGAEDEPNEFRHETETVSIDHFGWMIGRDWLQTFSAQCLLLNVRAKCRQP